MFVKLIRGVTFGPDVKTKTSTKTSGLNTVSSSMDKEERYNDEKVSRSMNTKQNITPSTISRKVSKSVYTYRKSPSAESSDDDNEKTATITQQNVKM